MKKRFTEEQVNRMVKWHSNWSIFRDADLERKRGYKRQFLDGGAQQLQYALKREVDALHVQVDMMP